MPRLIWVFAGRTFILLVLSCRGSHCLPVCCEGSGKIASHRCSWGDTWYVIIEDEEMKRKLGNTLFLSDHTQIFTDKTLAIQLSGRINEDNVGPMTWCFHTYMIDSQTSVTQTGTIPQTGQIYSANSHKLSQFHKHVNVIRQTACLVKTITVKKLAPHS